MSDGAAVYFDLAELARVAREADAVSRLRALCYQARVLGFTVAAVSDAVQLPREVVERWTAELQIAAPEVPAPTMAVTQAEWVTPLSHLTVHARFCWDGECGDLASALLVRSGDVVWTTDRLEDWPTVERAIPRELWPADIHYAARDFRHYTEDGRSPRMWSVLLEPWLRRLWGDDSLWSVGSDDDEWRGVVRAERDALRRAARWHGVELDS